jgi:hypothetical protein
VSELWRSGSRSSAQIPSTTPLPPNRGCARIDELLADLLTGKTEEVDPGTMVVALVRRAPIKLRAGEDDELLGPKEGGQGARRGAEEGG